MKKFVTRLLPYLFVASLFLFIVGFSQTDTLTEKEEQEIQIELLKVKVQQNQD